MTLAVLKLVDSAISSLFNHIDNDRWFSATTAARMARTCSGNAKRTWTMPTVLATSPSCVRATTIQTTLMSSRAPAG